MIITGVVIVDLIVLVEDPVEAHKDEEFTSVTYHTM